MKSPFRRITSIILPILAYILIYYSGITVFGDVFAKKSGALFPIFLSALITTPVLYFLYRRIPVVRMDFTKEALKKEWPGIPVIAAAGVLLNLAASALIPQEFLGSYDADRVLLSGNIILVILTDCVLIPAMEEILFRGIVLGQLLLWIETPRFLPVLLSALLFGAFHFNAIQFAYGLLMGILLGIYYEKTRQLIFCIFAHGLTNLLVILLF